MSSEKLVRGVATSGGLEGCGDFWLRVASCELRVGSWRIARCGVAGCAGDLNRSRAHVPHCPTPDPKAQRIGGRRNRRRVPSCRMTIHPLATVDLNLQPQLQWV